VSDSIWRELWQLSNGRRMFTVDASVWVNGFDQREPGHEASREFLTTLRMHAIPIVVLNLVLAEVAGAISRTRSLPAEAQEFAGALGELPNVTIIAMDLALAHLALAIAGDRRGGGRDTSSDAN
jgi:predicted nucleic acid-binding protein